MYHNIQCSEDQKYNNVKGAEGCMGMRRVVELLRQFHVRQYMNAAKKAATKMSAYIVIACNLHSSK